MRNLTILSSLFLLVVGCAAEPTPTSSTADEHPVAAYCHAVEACGAVSTGCTVDMQPMASELVDINAACSELPCRDRMSCYSDAIHDLPVSDETPASPTQVKD